MKKVFLFSACLVAVSLIPMAASADDSSSIESNAYVSIEKNDGSEIEKPVNPIDPTKPVKPVPEIDGEENPHPPSTKGPLSINYVSNLRFGSQKAQGNDAIYKVKPDQLMDDEETVIEVPNYIQITDNRGTNVGWRLTVKQNGAFKNGSNDLAGTELVFTNPVLSAKSGKTETAPTANPTFTLTADGQEALVMNAEAGHGMGTWADRFGDTNDQATSSIQLKIPGDSKKVAGLYKTSLTWTLSDSPQQ
ncbi:WxL domain-containing protein [Enterococcus ureasiticus]|uniref:WxL domain-containing protein n=1 Tax=Enterococcus ureasiticus TaxID=903984 RepID=A0A1E5GHL8_9ENTE|nr:WxL domain-containing protein [Enterococcus ureasiticus]OEG12111.1 hypothetical protein BCR21_07695 [Enterococcus ureasiticus]